MNAIRNSKKNNVASGEQSATITLESIIKHSGSRRGIYD